MKELTLNEMEYISGGFNLFGAASGFASFVANSGVGFTSFVLTSGTAFASFVGDSAMAFGSFLTGQSNWETFVTAGKENWGSFVNTAGNSWNIRRLIILKAENRDGVGVRHLPQAKDSQQDRRTAVEITGDRAVANHRRRSAGE